MEVEISAAPLQTVEEVHQVLQRTPHTVKWLMLHFLPKVCGDKVALDVASTVAVMDLTDNQLVARTKALLGDRCRSGLAPTPGPAYAQR